MTTQDDQDFREGVPFLGGALWIDLLNTTPVIDGQSLDLVGDRAALQTWTRLAGLEQTGLTSSDDVTDAHSLRALLRPVFDDLSTGLKLSPAVVQAVNAVLRRVTVTRQLADDSGAPQMVEVESRATGAVAAAVAIDFARFATDHEAARLRHCSNPACTMVFYDRGKNNRRRWCSMQACGNRAKVASYRERKAARNAG